MSAELCYRGGSGRPIVLLHGFTGSPHSFSRAAAIAPESDQPIWALALPGHDPGTPVAGGFEANIRTLAERLRRIEDTAVDLIGYSLGARCALSLAINHPERVHSATLIGVHPGLGSVSERAERARADQKWIDLLRGGGIEAFTDAWEKLPLWDSQSKLVEDSAIAAQREIRLGHDAEGLARSLEEMGLASMPDYRDVIAELPLVLVTGELDGKFTDIAAELGRPHRIVRGCGHNVVLESPESIWPVR